MKQPIVEVKELTKHFVKREGLFKKRSTVVQALDRVNLSIEEGKTLGVVGESGCGKTTLGRCILCLIPATGGEIRVDGENMLSLSPKELRDHRQNMQMVFQNPYSSLNPRLSVHNLIAEPLVTHAGLRGEALTERVLELLLRVGLYEDHLYRYPHEFSGGQLQRIAVARALSLNPKFMVLDEPTSALDVSVQASILNLLQELQDELNLTYLFISHDLSVIEHLSDRIAIMYLGRVVETGPSVELFNKPRHPYTEALLSSTPDVDPTKQKEQTILEGDVPSPADPPSGCYFHTRCPLAFDRCPKEKPEPVQVSEDHWAACHLVSEGQAPPNKKEK
jgi:oligopeptide/dipeptide ABC transporter ATP-binding protein